MRVILASRSKIFHESSSKGEACVLYVPKAVEVRQFRDLQGKSSKEIAERYGVPQQQPLFREEKGELSVYGTLLPELAQRRHHVKAYLPEDFLPSQSNAFYYLFDGKYIVHGLHSVTDEGAEGWSSSVITLQGGDPVKIITSAISERMLDGDAAGIYVAVDANLAVYEELKTALSAFNINVSLFSTLSPNKKLPPLYQHKDRTIPMVLFFFLAALGCLATLMYWFVNQEKVSRLNDQIRNIQYEIQEIQSNDKLGHILQPRAVLEKMSEYSKRDPSSFMNAGAQIVSQFGDIQKIEVDLKETPPVSNFDTLQTLKSVVLRADVQQKTQLLLVDQERLAKQLVEDHTWLHQIDNVSAEPTALEFQLYLGVEERKR